MNKVKVKNATKAGYIEVKNGGVLDLSFPDSKTRRGRVIDDGETSPTLDTGCEIGVIQIGQLFGTEKEPNPSGGRVYDPDGLMRTLGAGHGMSQPLILDYPDKVRIRKMTPKECFRLQGWTDDYFEKAQFVNSNSQLYKQAGNGVTVNVIYEIARRMK